MDSLMISQIAGDTIYAMMPLVIDSIPKKDSTKIWFHKYIKFKNRGIKDSLNPYYFKLLKK